MANHNREKENKDLELLHRYSVLRVDSHQEKLARFKVTKAGLYRQFTEVNEKTFMELETRLHSQEAIIKSLKRVVDSYAHDLSQHMALAEALNSEAVKNARLALSLAPIGPDAGPRRPRLSLIKA